MQAKDIPDDTVLAMVERLRNEQYAPYPHFDLPRSVNTWELSAALLPAMTEGEAVKLTLAKCASLIRRGLLAGCACGCRGDFEPPRPAVTTQPAASHAPRG